LLPADHSHDNHEAPEMQIGEADDNFFDSQEEDFYYDDYNDDDEEEREVWEDGEEVHLQVPAELLHAPDRRGKKRMRMQRRPYNRGDAEISATTAALFASPPPSPAQSFQAYFQHTTAAAMANTNSARLATAMHAGGSYAGESSARGGEPEVRGGSFRMPNGLGGVVTFEVGCTSSHAGLPGDAGAAPGGPGAEVGPTGPRVEPELAQIPSYPSEPYETPSCPSPPTHMPSCPSQPALRRSTRLSRAMPMQPTPAEQELGEDSDGDPMYDNPEMPNDTFYDSFEEQVEPEDAQYGNFEEGHGNVPPVVPLDPSSTQHLFWEGTWSQSSNTFSPEPLPYSGGPSGLKHDYTRMPTYLHLFGLFWTHTVLRRICAKTNRYAQEDDGGKPKGGDDWYDVDEGELRAFMGVRLWMGMRKQPNIKTFWARDDDVFHCPRISGLFTRKRFETLSKCLHLTNMDDGMLDRNSLGFDKVAQCRWLIDVIRGACKSIWQLGAYCTIDEMMVRY
jgi:hypothetical protein